MSIKTYLTEKIINRYVKEIQKDPDNNLDNVLKKIGNLSKDTALEDFLEWVRENPGPYGLFKEIFKRDERQVNTFFKNMIVHSGLEWIINNKDKDPSVDFPAPFTILISPTMRCNLSCEGCYAISYNRKTDMDKELFDRILTEGEEMGTHFYTLLGGEPSLKLKEYKDIFKKHDNSIFQMFTNGTLLSKDEKTLETIIEAGNIIPVLSVDGRKDITDKMRGNGVYDTVLDAASKLKENNLLYGISLVLTRENADVLQDEMFYDEWIDRKALFSWIFLYMPVSPNSTIDLMPTPEQRKKQGEFVNEYRKKKPFFIMDFWNDAPAVDGCIAGRRYMHITNEGDVEPCIFVHQSVDNIKEKSLKEVWNSDYFKAIRLHQPHTDNLLMPCMIIDNPKNLREIIEKYHPKSNDNYSVNRILELSEVLDKYSEEVAKVLDPVYFTSKAYKNKKGYWQEKGKAHEEGFDRIWYENLSEEEKEKYKKYIE